MLIYGKTRWGVNGLRDAGTYTCGPHNGYETRKEAEVLLKRLRSEERLAREETAYLKAHPEKAVTMKTYTVRNSQGEVVAQNLPATKALKLARKLKGIREPQRDAKGFLAVNAGTAPMR